MRAVSSTRARSARRAPLMLRRERVAHVVEVRTHTGSLGGGRALPGRRRRASSRSRVGRVAFTYTRRGRRGCLDGPDGGGAWRGSGSGRRGHRGGGEPPRGSVGRGG